MLSRYTMYRGPRPDDDPLPKGIRQDTRKHTRHCLRPPGAAVNDYLANPNTQAWEKFAQSYRAVLKNRFREQRDDFDKLAELASEGDVYLGCSCPTRKNPDVRQCHTVLALKFMRSKYPDLSVVLP